MVTENITSCPVCAATSFQKKLTVKDYTVSQQDFDIVTCSNCSFAFTNPRPDKSRIGEYYVSEKYISHTGGSKSLQDNVYLLARSFTLRWKEKIIGRFSSPSTLLDYGCGTGNFLFHMKQRGWNTTGVEPSEVARDKASAYTTVFPTIESINQLFKVITLWHVLEHIHDFSSVLSLLKQKLETNGTIFIAVPNLKSYDAQYYQSHWAAYDVPRHLWHFDKKAMQTVLENSGLKLIKTVPMKLDAYYVALLSETYKTPKAGFIGKVTRAISVAFKSNRKARQTQEYSSHIYIAQHA